MLSKADVFELCKACGEGRIPHYDHSPDFRQVLEEFEMTLQLIRVELGCTEDG